MVPWVLNNYSVPNVLLMGRQIDLPRRSGLPAHTPSPPTQELEWHSSSEASRTHTHDLLAVPIFMPIPPTLLSALPRTGRRRASLLPSPPRARRGALPSVRPILSDDAVLFLWSPWLTRCYRAGGPSGQSEDRRQPLPQLRHCATPGEFPAPASPLAPFLLTQTQTSLLICVRSLGVTSLLGSGGPAPLGFPSPDTSRNELLDADEYEAPNIGEEPPDNEFVMTH
jgi:hypothetical protein